MLNVRFLLVYLNSSTCTPGSPWKETFYLSIMATETCWVPNRPLAVFDPLLASPPTDWGFAVENFPVPAWQLCWRLFLFLPWQHPVVWARHLLSAGVSLKVMHGACSAALQECKIPCSQNPLLHLVPAFVSWSLSATSVAHSYIIKTWN